MSWRLGKVLYFATICLLPPATLLVYPVIFLWRLDVTNPFFTAIDVYFATGAIIVLIDLWLSRRERRTKKFFGQACSCLSASSLSRSIGFASPCGIIKTLIGRCSRVVS